MSNGVVYSTGYHYGWKTGHEYFAGNGLPVSAFYSLLYHYYIMPKKAHLILCLFDFRLFYKWLNTLKVKTGLEPGSPATKGRSKQWMKDFKLVEWGPRGLFPEYLEMG